MKSFEVGHAVIRTSFIGLGAAFISLWAVSAGAIRNGTPVSGAPYNAVVEILATSTHPLCSGTLLSSNIVLTAAQCVNDKSSNPVFELSLGDGRTAKATAIWQHPLFDTLDGFNLAYDIALIRLDNAATSTWTDIVPLTIRDTDQPTSLPATAVGFGETETGLGQGMRRSGEMLITQYIGDEAPVGVWIPDAFLEAVPGNNLNQMFCIGDPGGPLLYQNQITGIASFRFVVTCNETGPGYYVSVARMSSVLRAAKSELEADPPVADAGPDQSIHVGQRVVLNGIGSFDNNTPTPNLGYSWVITSMPVSSNARLTGANTSAPSFVADVMGDYVLTLTVRDENGLWSTPDSMLVTTFNASPTAIAGPDLSALVGHPVSLDGSGSSDPDGDPMTFAWALMAPSGSLAVLNGNDTSRPTFIPDLPGNYTATLTVSDGFGGAGFDSLVVSAITVDIFAINQVAAALNAVGGLPPKSVTNRGNRQALQRLLTQAIHALQTGQDKRAWIKLDQAIDRTDGCVLHGVPDIRGSGRDWVTSCAAQITIYNELKAALDTLSPPLPGEVVGDF